MGYAFLFSRYIAISTLSELGLDHHAAYQTGGNPRRRSAHFYLPSYDDERASKPILLIDRFADI
jgi:hypothetical protein